MMNRTFHFSDKIPHLLFYPWEIKTWEDMLLAIVVVFLTATGLELMKLLNAKLGQKRRQNPLCAVQEPAPQQNSSIINHSSTQHSPLLSSLRIPSSVSKIRRRRFKFHVVESTLHIFQVAIGYTLMLVVMTYNVYLLITVILALTVGYFFLALPRRMREPHKVPDRHQSLTDSDRRSFGASTSFGASSSSAPIESAETSQNPYYGSLYQ